MTEQKRFMKRLFHIAVPIILQDLLSASVNLLGFLMIGQLGLNAINGVGLSNQVFFLFALVGFGIMSGSTILMAQFWGKRDVRNIYRVMGVCLVCALSAALLFAAAAICVPKTLIGFYSNEPAVIEEGARYLRIAAFSYILDAVAMTFHAACRATGNTKVPMAAIMAALTCNFAFTALFIFGLHMGVAGAATATVIARAVEVATALAIIRKLRLPIGTRVRNYFRGNRILLKRFFKVALPVMVNETVWALGTTLYAVAYKYCGNEAQGAVQISGQVFNLFWVVGMGFGSGCGVILANLLGAGDRDKAIDYARRALAFGMCVAAVMGVLLFGFSTILPRFYDVSPEVRGMATALLRIHALGILLKTFNFTTIVAILRSGGDTLFCLFVDLAGVWLFGMPLAFLGAAVLHWPVYLVLALIYSEEVVKAVLTAFRVASNKWAKTIV